MANDDRARLAGEIGRAHTLAEQAVHEKERIASEASDKVDQANAEIQNAQRVLADIEKERRLLAHAVRIETLGSRELRGWSAAIAETLGVSLFLPPGSVVSTNDATLFTAIPRGSSDAAPWLRVTPFDVRIAAEREATLSDTKELAYLVDGHLISGVEGKRGNERTWLFRVWQSASTTHFIQITDPGTLGDNAGVTRFLGTMTFE